MLRPATKQWLLDQSLLFISILGFYLLFMGAHQLLNPDEARYSEVTREMLANHSLWVPLLNGIPFFDKPVLFYWLQMSAMSVFGVSEWAARLSTVLLGTLGCLMTYSLGRVLYDRLTGIISAIVLATSLFYFLMSHYANLDLSVAVFITASLGFFILAIQYPRGKKATSLMLLAYVFAGLAVLTKGLIGLVFPIMIIGVWILMTRQWALLRRMHVVWGLLIVVAINLPWSLEAQKQHHEFWYYYFYIQQYSRFITSEFNDKQPVWFYLPVVFCGMLPWSLFLVQAITQKVKGVVRDLLAHKNELFLLLWPALIFIFFSIPSSKTLGYILPVFPPLALMVGYYLRQIWNCENKQRRVFATLSIAGLLAAMGLFLAKSHLVATFHVYLYLICFIFILSSIALWFCRGLVFRYSFTVLVVAFVILMTLLMSSIKALQLSAIPKLLPIIELYQSPDAVVVDYHRFDRDLPFYLKHPVTVVADWNNPKMAKKDSWRGIFAYENQYGPYPNLWTESHFWKDWHENKPLIAVLSTKLLPSFQKKAVMPVCIVGKMSGKIIVVNRSLLYQKDGAVSCTSL